jgi:multiple sugar transport system substrate-binding protein
MKFTRIILCAGLVLVFAAGVIFAGGNKQDSSRGSTVTLKFTYWGSPVERRAVENALANFEKNNPGIKVDAQHIPTDYLAKITAMVAGDIAPDVVYLSDTVATEWGEEGKLANVLEFLKTDPELKKEDFLDDIWYKWSSDAAVGTNTALETFAIFYNKDMFTAAGVELPPARVEQAWTWDKFVDIAKKLTLDNTGKHPGDPGFNPENIVQYGIQWGTGIGDIMTMVYSNGGRFLKPDGSALALTAPEAYEAIQKVADLMNVHHVAPTPVAAKNIPEISTALMTKRVAMVMTGQWSLLDLAANTNLNFDIGVLPKLKEYKTVLIGSPTAIFASTKHPQESWKLFKWLANPESSLELQAGGLWMPLLKKWYTDESLIARWATGNRAHPPSYRTAVMDSAINHGMAAPVYNVRNYGKISNIITPALDPVWLGEKTAQQALKEVEGQVNSLVVGFYDNSRNY